MNGWQQEKLENLAERIGMGPFGSNIKISTFVSKGIPVISGTHLNGIRLEDKDYNFITEEHAERLKSANVYPGDIVFTHAGNIGQVAYIPKTSKFKKYILSQRQFYLRCNQALLLPEFLTYYFKSREGQFQLLANANQTGVPSLAQPVSYLKSVSVPLPPLPEQRAIVGVLSSLDDKVDLLNQQNRTLEAMAEAIWRKMFIEEADPGWKKGKLRDLVKLYYGKGLREKDRVAGIYPVLGSNGIVGQHDKYLVKGPGIVIGRKGTLGTVHYVEEDFFPIDTTFYIKSQTNPGKLFFEYFLLREFAFEDMSSDSAVPGLNREIAESLECLIPKIESISDFNYSCDSFFEMKLANEMHITTLSQLRDTLLPKLMSGQVGVKYD